MDKIQLKNYDYIKPKCLSELILSLLDAIVNNGHSENKEKLCECLQNFGYHQPTLFLRAAHAFMLQHPKLTVNEKSMILSSINAVLGKSSILMNLDEQQGLLIINLVTQEITMTKENEEEWAESGKEVLMTLGKSERFVPHVMDALLQKFPPGLSHSPHKYIVKSLSTIAEHNPPGFNPFLTDILSRAVKLFPQLKIEQMKSVWSQALCSFCDSIIEYCHSGQINESNTSYDDIIKDYSDQMEQLYDVILSWVNSKDSKVRADALECVGTLCMMIDKKRIIKDVKKLVSLFTNLYRRCTVEEQLGITRGICHFLEASCEESEDIVPLDHYIDDILNNVFPHVCIDQESKETNYDEKLNSSSNSNSIKLRNESLRCFHVAAERFADKIVYYLLHKMQSVIDNVKLGAINLMRHLLNSPSVQMEDKRSLIIMGLKPMLTTETLTPIVKKGICQLCIALADHGFVDKDRGGNLVIDFLTKNLISDPLMLTRNGICYDSESQGLSTVHSHCAQALHTIAKTCDSSLELLWPHLFEFICMESYNPVAADIFKCIRIVANRIKEKNGKLDFENGFDNIKIANNIQVFSRLIVSLNASPLSAPVIYRIKESLLLMECLCEWFHPNLVKICDKTINKLLEAANKLLNNQNIEANISSIFHANLTAKTSKGCIKITKIERWNCMVMNFVTETIKAINSGDWRQSLAAGMAKQITLYGNQARDRSFLLTCIGSILSYITDNSFVVEHLLLIFRSANHSHYIERIGCAMAVGYCSQNHTDLVLTELENIAKWEHLKKSSSGFFSFMSYKTYTDQEMVNLRATLMLSYGYLMINCPVETIVQRLEKTVLVFLRIYMGNAKQDTVVREALLETMHLIARSIHSTNFVSEYKFDMRTELYGYIKEYVQSENQETLSSWVRLLACQATTSLIKLEPDVLEEELWDLVKVIGKYTLPLRREKSGLKTIDNDQASTMMEATVEKFRDVIQQMIKKKPTVETVFDLLKLFVPYFGSQYDHERTRVIDIVVLILESYKDHAIDISLGKANDFMPMYLLLARLCPRITDSLFQVRKLSLEAIKTTFSLWSLHRGFSKNHAEEDFDIKKFIKTYLSNEDKLDSNSSKRAIAAISEEVESRLPQSQIHQYLSVLFEMLTDKQSIVSSSAAQLLAAIIKNRGSQLESEAEFLTEVMLNKLPEIHHSNQTYPELLNALITLASHQLYTIVDVLLRQELPYSKTTVNVWQSLSRECSQFGLILDYLFELMGLIIDENKDSNNLSMSTQTFYPTENIDIGAGVTIKNITPECCAFLSAINVMMQAAPSEEILSNRSYQILAILLHLLSSIIDSKFPLYSKDIKENNTESSKETSKLPKIKASILSNNLRKAHTSPASLVADAIKTLLEHTKNQSIIEIMNSERAFTLLTHSQNYTNAIDVLCKALSDNRPHWIRPLTKLLELYMSSTINAHRISIAIVFSSLISRCPDTHGNFDLNFFDTIVQSLLSLIKDECLLVRKLSIRGLGKIPVVASICHAQSSSIVLEKYIKLAVESAMKGLDDTNDIDDQVTIESLKALDSLILVADSSMFENILQHLLLQLKICFEKENSILRSVSFSLLSELASKVGQNDIFIESLHSNIVSIAIHLNDEDELVRKKCVLVLKKSAELFTSPSMSTLIAKSFENDELPSNYNFFIKDFAMVVAISYPEKLNQNSLICAGYFNSTNTRSRMNSAIFIGYLLSELNDNLRSLIPTSIIFPGLAKLLKDSDPHVSLAAAKAISCLANFT
uniref:Maestro heat-like repeat-containing protein family member 1 n=1 Tax=Parastrongyloides trichosuri TaxID=131310 RepID=A0A0N4ZSF7_PARTI